MKDKSGFKKAWPIILLTIVVVISVSGLRYIDSITRSKIEAQQEQKIESMLSGMFPKMTQYDYDAEDDIYTIKTDGKKIGYAFIATGQGYGGDIDILVGLEDETTIKSISIISQKETPGLGTRITESPFIDNFNGLKINDAQLSRDDGKVDAITGSTISSRAVVDAVRTTALEKVKLLNSQKEGS